jgi:signal transduction histidine kinase/ABC-type uncharacterized transport system substrate-binding protein
MLPVALDRFRIARLLGASALCLLGLAARLGAESPSIAVPRHILIINSYQKGYNWTDEQSESALAAFKRLMPEATEDVVYMDWKRHPVPETIDDIRTTLAHRYSSTKIDLIVTTDDAALSFALENRKAILWDAPVVFMGVFASSDLRLTGAQAGVTGVYETVDLEGTIKLALSVLPRSRRIYVIHDKSETSLSMESDINAILDKMGSALERRVLGGLVFADLLKELGAVPRDSIVLLASYARDPNNLTMQPEEFARAMSESCPVPLFVLYTHMMGTGALGGSLLDGKLQGEAAAELGKAILEGAAAESLPRIARETVYPCFDYRQLERFRIDSSRLPKGSVILGKPFSFFETYKALILATLLVLSAMGLLILFLLLGIRRRRRVELELRQSRDETARLNAELERRVSERTADLALSNERLGRALEEVKASREREIEREKLVALGHLTADIAHDLNTPLAAALAAERMMAKDNEPLLSLLMAGDRLSDEEYGCLRRLLSLAVSAALELDHSRSRALRKRLKERLETLGAGDAETMAEELAEVGYPDDGQELPAWIALPRFEGILMVALGVRSDVQSRLIVKGAVEKAAEVVAALKRYSRPDGSESLAEVDLPVELDAALTLFHGKAKRGVEIVRDYGDVPRILSRPERLSQVWMNLIDNALFAMSYKGRLKVSLFAEGDCAAVEISDSGPGIPLELRSKIFQPFFTTKPRGEGTGLGLCICRREIEELGGTIDFATSPEGTAFKVVLPRAI